MAQSSMMALNLLTYVTQDRSRGKKSVQSGGLNYQDREEFRKQLRDIMRMTNNRDHINRQIIENVYQMLDQQWKQFVLPKQKQTAATKRKTVLLEKAVVEELKE